ncbi:MAG: peptidoglycan DD-metalloendopeptidase family protein [Eubacterium sp.]|nr:peptidoglycan DD-metalloendopeptidase family protein [Candidatus Colimonas fimequi]
MRNKKLAIIIAIMMAVSFGMSTATVSAKTLAEVNNSIRAKQAEISKQKEESQDLSKKISGLEKEIKETEGDIEELESAIVEASTKLSKLKVDLKKAQKEVDQQNTDLSARLRSMYKNGSVGFVDVLLQSGNFSEFLTNLDLVQMVYASDKEVLEDLQKNHAKIKKQKKEIESLKAELDDSKALALETKKDLKSKKAEVAEKKSSVDSDIAQTQEEIDALEAEAQALTSKIQSEGSSEGTSEYIGNGPMLWPAPSYTRISCYFGWRTHPITGRKNYHGGTDLAAPGGSPILAAESGKVIIAAYHYSYGNYVVVDHGGGIATLYAHSSKLLVKKGDFVTRGQKIALVGTTGSSTGNHLHFEVRKNGVRVNGLPYIQ